MKSVLFLLLALFSFSSNAAEILLYKAEGADRYRLETVNYKYRADYQAIILHVKLKPGQFPAKQPELADVYWMGMNSRLMVEDGTFYIKLPDQLTMCAYEAGMGMIQSGLCKVMKKVVNNTLYVTLKTNE